MAQLIVRNLDECIKVGLRSRAKRNGRSMEEEVRTILSVAASESVATQEKLGTWMASLLKGKGLDGPIQEHRGSLIKPAIFK